MEIFWPSIPFVRPNSICDCRYWWNSTINTDTLKTGWWPVCFTYYHLYFFAFLFQLQKPAGQLESSGLVQTWIHVEMFCEPIQKKNRMDVVDSCAWDVVDRWIAAVSGKGGDGGNGLETQSCFNHRKQLGNCVCHWKQSETHQVLTGCDASEHSCSNLRDANQTVFSRWKASG